MLKSLWVGLTVVVWLVTCLAFVAALASWATAAEPVSVASWRPAPAAGTQPVTLDSWRPVQPVMGQAAVSLASWRPPKREVTAAPAPPPPLVAATGYWQTQCTKKGCRLIWVSLH